MLTWHQKKLVTCEKGDNEFWHAGYVCGIGGRDVI